MPSRSDCCLQAVIPDASSPSFYRCSWCKLTCAVEQQYNFDRYVYGRLMAEGAVVYAKTQGEALEKAQRLFALDGSLDGTTFTLRQKPS